MSCHKKPSLDTHPHPSSAIETSEEFNRRKLCWARQLPCLALSSREGWTDADIDIILLILRNPPTPSTPHPSILACLVWLLRVWGVSKFLILIAIHSTNGGHSRLLIDGPIHFLLGDAWKRNSHLDSAVHLKSTKRKEVLVQYLVARPYFPHSERPGHSYPCATTDLVRLGSSEIERRLTIND